MIDSEDNTKIIKEKIADGLLKAVIRTCTIYNIPIYFTAATKNTPQETQYYTDGLPKSITDIELMDDRMRSHVMLDCGYRAKPKTPEEGKIRPKELRPRDVVDHTTNFNKLVLPELSEIFELCTKQQIPYFLTAVIKNNADGTEYYTSGNLPHELTEDRITDHFKIDREDYTVRPSGTEISEIFEPEELYMDEGPEEDFENDE